METTKKAKGLISSVFGRLTTPLRMVRRMMPSNQPRAGIKTVGAWAGSQALRDPKSAVKFASSVGIDRLDIIVNDHSKDRDATTFEIRDTSAVLRLADACHAANIEVHLMSWLMPHKGFITSAADKLLPLAQHVGARSIMWDAEEPWTLARYRMGYPDAAKLLEKEFRGGPSMGVTGIGYASKSKLWPLVNVCDYVVPQAYSTGTSGLNPKTVGEKFCGRWERAFGKPVVCGLAAYRQNGIKGYTPAKAMEAAVRSVPKEVNTVVYWYLKTIRRSNEIARAVSCVKQISEEKWA